VSIDVCVLSVHRCAFGVCIVLHVDVENLSGFFAVDESLIPSAFHGPQLFCSTGLWADVVRLRNACVE
jgi:hypothetical protein